jgi:hypothetical protein
MRFSRTLLVLTAALTAQATKEVEITAEPHHHLVLTNDEVRVFSVDVPAHSETLMHRHRHDYIYVVLGASEVVNAVQGKDPVTINLHDGDTQFLPGGFAHIARNLAAQPFRNVTVELLQDDKRRHSTFQWDTTRGLDILHGGTSEILFVKDTVRVTEFELQPGGMVPISPAPYLLVAVSNLELLQTQPNASVSASTRIPRHSGEVQWFPVHHHNTLTNAGHGVAKFITLEFPKE